ncbi:MAG TPA: hypothetical protein VHQ01_05820, partial [Pyrinomonadaceae bacterium]|nr:hypothetical protein [Pyrinomonadaceae bacterium]
EIALNGTTLVAEVYDEKVDVFEISATDFDVFTLGNDLPSNCTADESAAIIRDILDNKLKDRDAERLVLINAAAALYVAGKTADLPAAMQLAAESIRNGSAVAKLEILRTSTN